MPNSILKWEGAFLVIGWEYRVRLLQVKPTEAGRRFALTAAFRSMVRNIYSPSHCCLASSPVEAMPALNAVPSICLAILAVAVLTRPAASFDAAAVDKLVDPRLAAQASVIEVVTVGGKLSHVEYSSQAMVAAAAVPPLPGLTLILPKMIPYGSLASSGANRYRRTGPGPGGLRLELAGPGQACDLLSYETVTIDGVFSGQWTVALADETLAQREENRPLKQIGGAPTGSFSLNELISDVDLARARYLVFRLEGTTGGLALQAVAFSRADPHPAPPMRAAWLWDGRRAIENPRQLLALITRSRINRLYMQVSDDLESFAPFLALAAGQGVTVWALDGSPEGVNDFTPLLSRIDAVAAFNRRRPAEQFAGFQLDVEPYLLKDFSLHRFRYTAQYLELLDAAGSRCHKAGIFLSAALPFWFNQISINGRDLAWEAVRRVDEIVVMGYRTDYTELLNLTRPLLAASEKLGKPALLGIELTPIPDEVHDVLRRAAPAPRAINLGGDRWELVRSYTVPGARLSFASQPAALPGMLKNSPPFRSFKGWVLHSIEALEALP